MVKGRAESSCVVWFPFGRPSEESNVFWDAELQGDHLDRDLGTGGGNLSCCRFTK